MVAKEVMCGDLTWLFESSEDGLSTGVLRICELHDAVVVRLIQTEHSIWVVLFWKGERKQKKSFNQL